MAGTPVFGISAVFMTLGMIVLITTSQVKLPGLRFHRATRVADRMLLDAEPATVGSLGKELRPAEDENPPAAVESGIAWACSAKFKARNAVRVRAGSTPLLLDLKYANGTLDVCRPELVTRLADAYRRRQQHDFLNLVPCDVFKLIQGRTLWIVGDSLQLHFSDQLDSFLLDFYDTSKTPYRNVPAVDDPDLYKLIMSRMGGGCPRHCKGNGHIPCCGMSLGPRCTLLMGGTRLCFIRANKGNLFLDMVLPNFDLLNITAQDFFVLNFGAWHSYTNWSDFQQPVRQLVKHYKAHRATLPTMIWRDAAVQHFKSGGASGEYRKQEPGGKGNVAKRNDMTCSPTKGALLQADGSLRGGNIQMLKGGPRNSFVVPLIRKAGIHRLDTWNETIPLFDMHKQGECTHYCSPGAYSVWIWRL